MKIKLMLYYLHEDMHALLYNIKVGRDPGYRRQGESAFIYGSSSVDHCFPIKPLACIMPAYMQTPPATSLTEMHYGTCTVKLDV